jgi:microcystin-dependent protein
LVHLRAIFRDTASQSRSWHASGYMFSYWIGSKSWPPPKTSGGSWTEDELGWKLCDGRPLEGSAYGALRKVLGKDHLPNLCGCFLRGLDKDFAGNASGKDKGSARIAGDEQGYATARPSGGTKFATSEEPEHVFDLMTETDAGRNNGGLKNTVTCSFNTNPRTLFKITVPKHSHTIDSGGDRETRPTNVAIYWIIKFK